MAHEEEKMDRDEVLVKLVEHESVIWKRNHPHFKTVVKKEEAWARVAFQLGISTTEAERRFKSIREKYRRRKILLERDVSNNVEHSKLKRWDLYNKLSFLDDFMIPRNGNESLGMIMYKGESVSSENISSTNEVSIMPVPNNNNNNNNNNSNKPFTSTPNSHHRHNHHHHHQQNNNNNSIGNVMISRQMPEMNISRSSQSTPSPSTTTANLTAESHENMHLNPIVKMEVADDDDDDNNEMISNENNNCNEPKSCENGNFNYVGEYIAAELNKLPIRHAFTLKNILIREVLEFSEKIMLAQEKQ